MNWNDNDMQTNVFKKWQDKLSKIFNIWMNWNDVHTNVFKKWQDMFHASNVGFYVLSINTPNSPLSFELRLWPIIVP